MSNERSPREVCSITIGISGFTPAPAPRPARARVPGRRRPRALGTPAVPALDRRAPNERAPEDAGLGADRQIVVPRTELAARVDAALADARRSLVMRPARAAADG